MFFEEIRDWGLHVWGLVNNLVPPIEKKNASDHRDIVMAEGLRWPSGKDRERGLDKAPTRHGFRCVGHRPPQPFAVGHNYIGHNYIVMAEATGPLSRSPSACAEM